MKRSITSLRILCEAAKEYGVSVEQCLEGTSLAPSEFENPEATIHTWQEIQAIQNISRNTKSTLGLGVAVGNQFNMHAFGIWGFAILTSPTIRSAIQTAIEFANISFLLADMDLVESDGTARVVYDVSDLPLSARTYAIERHSYITINFTRELLQEPDLNDFTIEMTSKDTDYASDLAELIGIDVLTHQDSNALTFPAELLDKRLPKSDPATLSFCLNQCKILAAKMEDELPPWSQKVRAALMHNISEERQVEEIAKEFAVSERTLRRRLSEEGTSFRQIYTDTRMTIAYELLEMAGLNVETVSWRVGYAEPASFAHAFLKKYGKTPGDVRKRHTSK